MHQVLRRGPSINLFEISSHRTAANTICSDYQATEDSDLGRGMRLKLPQSDEYPLPKEGTLEVGRYYRPESTTFPTFDSFFIVDLPESEERALLMFQITRNKAKHDVKPDGLFTINKLIPEGIHKYYVAVTPEGLRPKITIPNSYFRDAEDLFPVYRFPVAQAELFRDSE